MTIILAKRETVSYFKLSYVLYDSLKRVKGMDGSRTNEFVDKCDTLIQDKVWLFSSFNPSGYSVYKTIETNLITPLKNVSLNYAIGIVDEIRRFTEGSPDYRALILDEFSQGDMIEIINGKAIPRETFIQFPISEGRDEIELLLRRFDIIPRILNADISGLDKIGLRGRLKWSLIGLIKRRSPLFAAHVIEAAFNNDFKNNFQHILRILVAATGELGIEIKKVIDRIEDPLDRLFDFPLYAKFILSSYNNGYLQNYIHNMNSPLKFDRGFKMEGVPEFKNLIINGRGFLS